MAKRLHRLLAVALSATLCVSSIPATGLAEAIDRSADDLAAATAQASVPKALYKLHALGAQTSDEEAEWHTYVPAGSSAQAQTDEQGDQQTDEQADQQANDQADEQPLDAIAVKLDGDATGISYRVRKDENADWPEEWTRDGEQAKCEEGISAVEIRLADELSDDYTVWYRTRTQARGWLGWAKDGETAGSAVSPIVELQVTVQSADDPAPADNQADATDPAAGEEAAPADPEATPEADATQNPAYEELPAETPTEPTSTEPSAPAEEVAATDDVTVPTSEDEPTIDVASDGLGDAADDAALTTQAVSGVQYQAHVQRKGWLNWVKDGATGGTSGKALRVEGIRIKLNGIDGGIRYRTHVQKIGWQGWKSNGTMSGTSGRRLRLEAIRIELTGNAASQYDVYYRTHVQKIGWMNWAKNGEIAGSSDLAYRMEAIQVMLVRKGASAPYSSDATTSLSHLGAAKATYAANLKDGGWQSARVNGKKAGKTGVSARIQQLWATLDTNESGIRYDVCANGDDWQGWSSDGGVAGIGSNNLTAVRFELTGLAEKHFNVWYRVHVAKKGWLGWTSNGSAAGTDSGTHPIEAIQVKVLAKRYSAPGPTTTTFFATRQLDGVDISGYDKGINTSALTADFVIVKATEGYDGTIWNPDYKSMADNALSSGKLIGFYHYANGLDAKKEAQQFYNAIKDYKGRAIACLDWEGQGNQKFESGVDVNWCKTFLDEMKRLFGGTPFIYTSKNVTNAYNWSAVAKSYPLWGAEYAYADVTYQGYLSDPWQSAARWGAWGSKPTIHQYGYVNPKPNNGGITQLDADKFFGTVADWKSYQ